MTMKKVILLASTILFMAQCQKELTPKCAKNCALTPDAGVCLAAFPKFYFDPKEKICKQFTWGGCGGVVPFQTKEECEACKCH
jgi:Kunitz/Bovine pancreatic trypsin inhibitor domain